MYKVHQTPAVESAIGTLPVEALTAYAELLAALEVAPWGFPAAVLSNPDGELRRAVFGGGSGLAFYVIIEQAREVTVVELVWITS
jgi:hypothetical protein